MGTPDYNKDDLIKLFIYLEDESIRVKTSINSSGFTKYSAVGIISRNYRKELKSMMKLVAEDLMEDFNFNVYHFADIEAWKTLNEVPRSRDKHFIENIKAAQDILDGRNK